MPAPPALELKLRQWKNQLIDSSKRNRLLFFRPTKTTTLRLTEPEPEVLFEHLVVREKSLNFVEPPSAGDEPEVGVLDLELVEDAPEEAAGLARPLPPLKLGEVRTDRDDRQLRGVLYNLRLRGRTAVAEQGTNILFVA